jgi:hypothetical protein
MLLGVKVILWLRSYMDFKFVRVSSENGNGFRSVIRPGWFSHWKVSRVFRPALLISRGVNPFGDTRQRVDRQKCA